MSMRRFISKLAVSLFAGLLFLPATIQASEWQSCTKDTVIVHDTVYLPVSEMPVSGNRYDKRIRRYRRHWNALIPSYSKMQFAGNMGLLSFGTGWDYGKHNCCETDVFIGFLPRYESKRAKMTFTVKQNYFPWKLPLGDDGPFMLEPLSCGLYLNTVFGDEFWTHEPERYPKGFYGFSTKVRFNVYVGQRITYEISKEKRFSAKAISLFYELSTSDLYIVSAFTNRYLRPRDYLSLSLGIKLQML